MINENNRVTIVGQVGVIEFSHSFKGENFYRAWVSIHRLSDTVDTVPVIVPELLLELRQVGPDCNVCIEGQYRQRNTGRKSDLYVFANEISLCCEIDSNKILLNGYIGKQPIYRQTPTGREITDTIMAVNRPNKKADYIPCIFWGRNAERVSILPVGSHLILEGRIQSREYQKQLNGQFYTLTAYEVSISMIDIKL